MNIFTTSQGQVVFTNLFALILLLLAPLIGGLIALIIATYRKRREAKWRLLIRRIQAGFRGDA